MRSIRSAAFAFGFALAGTGLAPAHADIFTWTDASGRTNISNVEPPKDAHARRIVQKEAPRKPVDEASRAAAQAAEMQALRDRVSELEAEVDQAKQRANVQAYRAPLPAPAPVVVVTAPPAYAPSPAVYPGPADFATCDALTFGCPAFGYPVNVVVLKNGRLHHFDRLRAEHRMRAIPVHPAPPPRRR